MVTPEEIRQRMAAIDQQVRDYLQEDPQSRVTAIIGMSVFENIIAFSRWAQTSEVTAVILDNNMMNEVQGKLWLWLCAFPNFSIA
ncbi:hypothetical protein KCU92_g8135, partial [Aureobasidium melanogenum]|jgi:hypothetical protein